MILAPRTLRTVAEALQPVAGGTSAAARRQALTDWTKPLAFANAHLLAPALYANLAAAGRLAEVPAEARDYLELLYRLNRDRNDALRQQAMELLRALNAVGVIPLLLKGGLSLFGGIYPDPAARMIRDIDVLVAAEQIPCAVEALGRLGYRLIARYEAGHNAYGDFARPHDPGAVDLHTELVEVPYLLPAADVRTRARPVNAAADATFLAPAPTDAALHHLLHAQIHHLGNFYRGVIELRQLHEFALLIDRERGIDWSAIHEHLARHRLGVALESYAVAAQHLFDCRWPLPAPPSRGAALQCQRSLLYLWWPGLARLGIPLANVRSAFAWHRMRQLYAGGPLSARWWRHAAQFMRKTPPRDVLGRLFRTQ